MPKDTQLVSGRGGIWTETYHSPKPGTSPPLLLSRLVFQTLDTGLRLRPWSQNRASSPPSPAQRSDSPTPSPWLCPQDSEPSLCLSCRLAVVLVDAAQTAERPNVPLALAGLLWPRAAHPLQTLQRALSCCGSSSSLINNVQVAFCS